MHHYADDQYIEIPLLVFCKLFLILIFKMHPGNEALLEKKKTHTAITRRAHRISSYFYTKCPLRPFFVPLLTHHPRL